jgi:hypothetical protein
MSKPGQAYNKVGLVFCLGLVPLTLPAHSLAQPQKPTQISIQYKATLGGIYVGSAKMQIALTQQAYNIAASGSLSGVLKSLVGFRVDVKTYGTLANATMIPQRYSTEYGTANSLRSIKIDYSANRKAAVSAKPPFFPNRRRIALKPAHLKNTVDPLSALFLPVKKDLDTLSPDNCQRLMPVFDGRMRYNLKVSSITAKKPAHKIRGFDGPVLICRIKVEPIAGYSPPKPGTKKPPQNNAIEIWLTPMGSTGLLIPVKGRLPTPFGMAEISIRRLYLNGQKVAAL